jgi:hypothetical protein
MAIACLAGIGLLALSLVGVLLDATLTAVDRILGLISSIVPALLLVWLCYLAIWMANPGRPAVTLGPDDLIIDHRSLFRRPMHIPRQIIAAAQVDIGTEGSLRVRDRFRLEREDDHGDLPDWLYSKHGSPLPLVGHFREVPNVAILLREPIRFRSIRRVSRPVFRHSVRSPIRTKDVGGFTLAVEQPFLAEQVLRAWGVPIRAFTTEDAVALRPSDADRRRQSYRTAFTVGVGLILLGSQAFLAFVLTGGSAGQRCENLRGSTSVRLSSEDAQDPPEVEDLSDVLIDSPSGWVPYGAGGESDLDAITRSRGREWAALVQEHDFERGYERSWSSGAIHLFEDVWEFESHPDAVAIQDQLLAATCDDAVDAYKIDGILGSTAVVWEEAGDQNHSLYFVRGPRLYQLVLTEEREAPSRSQLERFGRLADDQAR